MAVGATGSGNGNQALLDRENEQAEAEGVRRNVKEIRHQTRIKNIKTAADMAKFTNQNL